MNNLMTNAKKNARKRSTFNKEWALGVIQTLKAANLKETILEEAGYQVYKLESQDFEYWIFQGLYSRNDFRIDIKK